MADIYSNGQLMYIINMTQNVKYTTDNSNATIIVNANLKTRMDVIIGIRIYINNNLVKTIGEYNIAKNTENIYSGTVKIARASDAKKIPIKIETFCTSTSNKTVDGVVYNTISGHTTNITGTVPIASNVVSQSVDSFDATLDKITEAEVVYDFVERLSIGKDFTLKDFLLNWNKVGVLFNAKTKFLNLIKRIYISLPSVLVTHDDLKCVRIDIPKNSQIVREVINSTNKYSIVVAYSDKARIDVTPTVKYVNALSGSKDPILSNNHIEVKFDSPYPDNDTFLVYLKIKKL